MTEDPIHTHVAALDRVLRGPRRIRRGMVDEARLGLRDAAAAYRGAGMTPERAAACAVRDFGAVDEVAPLFQDELTARQGRWAASLFAFVFPGMLLAWDALWSSGLVRRDPVAAADLVVTLARLQDTVTVLVAAAAVALLAVTFLRDVSPRRVTRAIGVTGTVGALSCGALSVLMNVAAGHATAALLATSAAAVTAFAGSALVLALVVWQAMRTLRVARG